MVQHSPPPPLARRGRRRPLQGLLKHVLHQEAEILELLKGRGKGGLRGVRGGDAAPPRWGRPQAQCTMNVFRMFVLVQS